MQNFVAKHCRTFNKATVQRDRTKYHRESTRTEDLLDDWWQEDVDFDEEEWETTLAELECSDKQANLSIRLLKQQEDNILELNKLTLDLQLHRRLVWMTDLETLGTKNDSVVAEVSVVGFELHTGKIVAENTWHLSVDEQLQAGRTVTSGTLAFWVMQSEEARKKLLLALDEHCDREALKLPVSVDFFLTDLREFVLLESLRWEQQNPELSGYTPGTYPKPLVMGNGIRFDCGKIADLYEKANRETEYPWGYAGDADVRTLHQLAPHYKYAEEFVGVPHYGLDDCKHQIKYVVKTYKTLLLAQKLLEEHNEKISKS